MYVRTYRGELLLSIIYLPVLAHDLPEQYKVLEREYFGSRTGFCPTTKYVFGQKGMEGEAGFHCILAKSKKYETLGRGTAENPRRSSPCGVRVHGN